jgi:hypothetical protein
MNAVECRSFSVFNVDNSAHFHGAQQAFFYVEHSPDGLTVREYATNDAWKSGAWTPLVWRRAATATAANSATKPEPAGFMLKAYRTATGSLTSGHDTIGNDFFMDRVPFRVRVWNELRKVDQKKSRPQVCFGGSVSEWRAASARPKGLRAVTGFIAMEAGPGRRRHG